MKSKKLLLGLGAVTTALAPVAAVISCDNNKASTDADKKADAKAGAKTDGKTGGKVNPVVQGPLVRKMTTADKGLVVAIGGSAQRVFITEEEAKTETTITMAFGTLVLPAMTKTSTNHQKIKQMLSATDFKDQQDTARKAAEATARTATPNDQAAITAAGDAAVAGIKPFTEIPMGAITNVVVNEFILNERFIAANVNELKEMVKHVLITVNGKGIYKFEFTDASLKTNTPVLTTASDAAFKKIFTDLGLTLSNLVFEKSTSINGRVAIGSHPTGPEIIGIKSLDLA